MKRVINVFVEGENEVQFFRHLILFHLGMELRFEKNKQKSATGFQGDVTMTIREIGGIDRTKLELVMKEIQTDAALGIESVIIIDADTPFHSKANGSSLPGGFARRSEFLQTQTSMVSFQFFVVPNGADDGNLEDAKVMCVSEHGMQFFECIERYIKDLKAIPVEKMPPKLANLSESLWKKNHINWYEIYMVAEKERKKDGFDLLDDRIWNLRSEYLMPIKKFFEKLLELTPKES